MYIEPLCIFVFAVYMKPDDYMEGQFALDITPKLVQYFEKYFDSKYPFGKLDTIGLQQTAGTAMANWGLISIR